MKTKSIYRARMTKQQATIVLRCLDDYVTSVKTAGLDPQDVTKMAEIVAVSGLIDQVNAELSQAA